MWRGSQPSYIKNICGNYHDFNQFQNLRTNFVLLRGYPWYLYIYCLFLRFDTLDILAKGQIRPKNKIQCSKQPFSDHIRLIPLKVSSSSCVKNILFSMSVFKCVECKKVNKNMFIMNAFDLISHLACIFIQFLHSSPFKTDTENNLPYFQPFFT